jgi:hypothetical protein
MAKQQANIEQAIDVLAEKWLGRCGICGIHDESRSGRMIIVLEVTKPEPDVEYPEQFEGFPVVVKSGRPYVSE